MQDQVPQASGVKSGDVLAIAIPMILSNASVPLAGIADTAVVGQLNDPALIGGVPLGSTSPPRPQAAEIAARLPQTSTALSLLLRRAATSSTLCMCRRSC
ncbi:MAG: hypothetical protein WCD20_10315 [Rhodomicrobium sp.]